MGSVEEIAYREALRSISQQQALLESARSRAGTLLAAASIVAGFFGEEVLAQQNRGVLSWLGLAAFIVVGTCAVFVLWPRTNMQFRFDANDILSRWSGRPINETHRHLAEYLEDQHEENELRFEGTLLGHGKKKAVEVADRRSHRAKERGEAEQPFEPPHDVGIFPLLKWGTAALALEVLFWLMALARR